MDKNRIRHGFIYKFSLYIIACAVIVLLLVLIYDYRVSENAIIDNIKNNGGTLAAATLNEINTYFNTAQQIPQDISNTLESCNFTQKEMMGLLKTAVENCEEIYGATIAFEPYMTGENKYFFGPHFYKPDGNVKYLDFGTEKYNYFTLDWYTGPKKMNKGVWSEPYFAEGKLMVTYSEPFYKNIDGKRTFCGVVTCDIDLRWLEKLLGDIKVFNTGYAFILSSKGVFIGRKNNEADLGKGIFVVAESRGDDQRRELGKKMTSNRVGFDEYYSYSLGKKCFVSYAPLKETGWSIAVIIPQDEPFSDLYIITWNIFTIGAGGYLFILILIIMAISGFLRVNFYIRKR